MVLRTGVQLNFLQLFGFVTLVIASRSEDYLLSGHSPILESSTVSSGSDVESASSSSMSSKIQAAWYALVPLGTRFTRLAAPSSSTADEAGADIMSSSVGHVCSLRRRSGTLFDVKSSLSSFGVDKTAMSISVEDLPRVSLRGAAIIWVVSRRKCGLNVPPQPGNRRVQGHERGDWRSCGLLG